MSRFSFKPAYNLGGRKFHGIRGLSGKPFHPPLTDIPIGAYVIAPVLDLLSYFSGGNTDLASGLHRAAGYVFIAGAVAGLATITTGLADWLDTEAGTQIRRMANAHMLLMLLMSAVVLANLVYRFYVSDAASTDLTLALAAAVILGLLTLGSAIGGAMVYDYGFNVETAQDNPVYHQHEKDILHPHEEPGA